MRKLSKSLIASLLLISIIFTIGVDFVSQENHNIEIDDKEERSDIPSLNLEVLLEDGNYKKGDTIKYEIKLINDGQVDLKNISIKEDLNKEFILEGLKVKEENILKREYKIKDDNNLKEIINKLKVEVEFNGKALAYEDKFKVAIIEEKA